ncbi:MAG: osmotically inducible protein C [Rhodovulum sp.]|nr:osmotically inducible protein C [Rhodovulum sp.]
MPTEKFSFEGHAGDKLAARLDTPAGEVTGTVLFAHCFTCGKDIHAARRIAQRLQMAGLAVLRFDFTGLGHSGGEFANTSFSSNVEDLVLAAKALEARGLAPDLLIGHSLGGAAVLKAAAEIPSAKGVVTLGAPYDPGHVVHNITRAGPEPLDDGGMRVTLGGQDLSIGAGFLEDVKNASLQEAIAGLGRALLVMHAPRDSVVGVENATQIFAAAKHPKSFVTLDDADHLISRSEDAEYAASVIAAWATRYLGLRTPTPPPGAPEGVIRVSEADPAGFLQDIQNGPHHHLLADEPLAYGGTNKGLSPYGLVAAGLGACTSMTIRMYARRKGWPLKHVRVDVTHDKVHAQDAGTSATKIDRFVRNICVEGKLSADQRERLLEIADRCPVHHTLEKHSTIETHLSECR